MLSGAVTLIENSSLLAQLVERSAFKHSRQPKCQGFEPPMRSSFLPFFFFSNLTRTTRSSKILHSQT